MEHFIGFADRLSSRGDGLEIAMAYQAGSGGRRTQHNVLGGEIAPCSTEPLTGFFRDGCCNTSPEDQGSHTVCVVMTAEFLAFSKARGNDL